MKVVSLRAAKRSVFFLWVISTLGFLWAPNASAFSLQLTAGQLGGFLDDLSNSSDPKARSLASDLQQKLHDAGITYTEDGFSTSGTIASDTKDINCGTFNWAP